MKSKSLKHNNTSQQQYFNPTYFIEESSVNLQSKVQAFIQYLQKNITIHSKFKKQMEKIYSQIFVKIYEQKKKQYKLILLTMIANILLTNSNENLLELNIGLYEKIFECLGYYNKVDDYHINKLLSLIMHTEILNKLKWTHRIKPLIGCAIKCANRQSIKQFCVNLLFQKLDNQKEIEVKNNYFLEICENFNRPELRNMFIAKFIERLPEINLLFHRSLQNKKNIKNIELLLIYKQFHFTITEDFDDYLCKLISPLWAITDLNYFQTLKSTIYDKLIEAELDKQNLLLSIKILKTYRQLSIHRVEGSIGYENLHIIACNLQEKYFKKIKQNSEYFKIFVQEISDQPWIFSLNFYKNLLSLELIKQELHIIFAEILEREIKNIDSTCFQLENLIVEILNSAVIRSECFVLFLKKMNLNTFFKFNQFLFVKYIESIRQEKCNYKIKLVQRYFEGNMEYWRPLANEIIFLKDFDIGRMFYYIVKTQLSSYICESTSRIVNKIEELLEAKDIKGLSSLFFLLSVIIKSDQMFRKILLMFYSKFKMIKNIFFEKQLLMNKILTNEELILNNNQYDAHLNNVNKLKYLTNILLGKIIECVAQCQRINQLLLITHDPEYISEMLIQYIKENNVENETTYEHVITIISNLSRISSKNYFISDALTYCNNLKKKNYTNILKSMYFIKEIINHQLNYQDSHEIQSQQTIFELCLESLKLEPLKCFVQKQLLKGKIIALLICDKIISRMTQKLKNRYFEILLGILMRKSEYVGKSEFSLIIQLRCQAIESILHIFAYISCYQRKAKFVLLLHLIMIDESVEIRILLFKQLLSNKIKEISSLILLGVFDPNNTISELSKIYIKTYLKNPSLAKICSLNLNIGFFLQNFRWYPSQEKILGFLFNNFHGEQLSNLYGLITEFQKREIRKCDLQHQLKFYGKSKTQATYKNILDEIKIKIQKKCKSLGLKGVKLKELSIRQDHFLLLK